LRDEFIEERHGGLKVVIVDGIVIEDFESEVLLGGVAQLADKGDDTEEAVGVAVGCGLTEATDEFGEFDEEDETGVHENVHVGSSKR
jgi:hypothetical protein